MLAVMVFALAFTYVQAQNQESPQVLTGKITDSNGRPIAGAVVNVAEQSRIALTGNDGVFTLKNANFRHISPDEIYQISIRRE